MDLGTPTNDEPKKRKSTATTAAADTSSSEVAKKIKDHFRSKVHSISDMCKTMIALVVSLA